MGLGDNLNTRDGRLIIKKDENFKVDHKIKVNEASIL